MKSAFSFSLILFLTLRASAQFIEFGAGVGSFNYLGDLNGYPRPGQSGIGGQALYKLNFTEYATVRFSLAYGQLRGNDENPVDALAQERVHSFNQSIFELSTIAEISLPRFSRP